VAGLREQLRQGDKSLVGNKGYRRFLKAVGERHFAVDELRRMLDREWRVRVQIG
jgi:hypothetical protein